MSQIFIANCAFAHCFDVFRKLAGPLLPALNLRIPFIARDETAGVIRSYQCAQIGHTQAPVEQAVISPVPVSLDASVAGCLALSCVHSIGAGPKEVLKRPYIGVRESLTQQVYDKRCARIGTRFPSRRQRPDPLIRASAICNIGLPERSLGSRASNSSGETSKASAALLTKFEWR